MYPSYHCKGPPIRAIHDGSIRPEDGYLQTPAHEGEDDLEDVEPQLALGQVLIADGEVVEHAGRGHTEVKGGRVWFVWNRRETVRGKRIRSGSMSRNY